MNAPQNPEPSKPSRAWIGYLVFGASLAGVFVLGLLFASVAERRAESRAQRPLQPLAPFETDPAKWGGNHPREYSSYRRMVETGSRTKYGGAYHRDYLEETPANVILFAGYAFAKDYKQARGHLFSLEDVKDTLRLTPKSAGTCWTCKSPDAIRLMAQEGAEKFYAARFSDWKSEMRHPIACLDCHDPANMRLRIARPTVREAWERQGKNLDKVSHQEMRSLVCAQCHAEYYFKGSGNYLAFPWDKGVSVEEMEAHYDTAGFSDWVHAVSKAPMVKIQHPDYEVFTKGIHHYRNVACADCHMPYRSEGGEKFSDHFVRSPLLNIANSCAVCHRWSEEEIRKRVEGIQDKVREGREQAERAIACAHFDLAAAMQAGAGDEELQGPRALARKAQLRWDFVAASNGMGFHAPQECQRILGAAATLAQECRVECARMLARRGFTAAVRYPDYGSKEKAQALLKAFVEGPVPDLLGKK